jgi:hypothetical protein
MQTIQKFALMLALLASFLIAQPLTTIAADMQTYGDWHVGMQSGGLGPFASTVNDSGLVLGEYCYFKSKTCLWLVSGDSTCDDGAKYLALGNTDQGAASFTLECSGKQEENGHYVMLFQDWKSLEALMQKSSRLGLAVPMQSDQFKVWRFSLDGMQKSQSLMESAFFKSTAPNNSRPRTNTSTSTL